jgi:hypothetical protein
LIRREPKLPNELSTARQNKEFELPEIASQLAPLALAISPEAVFGDARKRIALVFKINLAVSIVLAAILLVGIGGAVYSAVFIQKAIWSLAFGGLSVADLIGVYVFKPLSAINAALIGATRLDTLQLRLNQQLSQCAGHDDLEARIRCQTAVWDVIQHELSILASSQPQKEPIKKKAPPTKIKPVH